MYSKAIEVELRLQQLIDENELLKEKIKEIEEEEKNRYNEKVNLNHNDIITTEVDIDIFKKIQEQMNKRAKISNETLNKYAPISSNDISNQKFQYQHENDSIEDNKNYNNISIDNAIIQLNKKTSRDNDCSIDNEDLKNNDDNNRKYQVQIFKLPSILLDNKIEEIGLYVQLELLYQKLTTKKGRINFITLLKQVLNNIVMLKQTCFTVFLQLFNFIITLLTFELSRQSQDSEIIAIIQSIGEFILINKDISDVLRIIIVMIKRFFPSTFKVAIDKTTELHLKILLFYLRKLTILIQSSHIHISMIFSEVNDFLYSYPPSLLSKQIPNIDLYLDIYQEIRTISDELIKSNSQDRLIDAVAYVKNKNQTPSDEYIKYLEYKLFKK